MHAVLGVPVFLTGGGQRLVAGLINAFEQSRSTDAFIACSIFLNLVELIN